MDREGVVDRFVRALLICFWIHRDIKKAIPAHCFEHSYVKSFGYLFVDLLIAFVLLRLTYLIDPRWPLLVRASLWTAYIWAQGCVAFGLWVVRLVCEHAPTNAGFAA